MGIWAVSKFGNYNNNAVNVMSFDEHMYTLWWVILKTGIAGL